MFFLMSSTILFTPPPPPKSLNRAFIALLTNNVTGLNIYYTTPVDLDTVVHCYARLHHRRLQLENVVQ